MNKKKVTILGDGGWGTALALVLSRKGLRPTLWGAFPKYIDELRKTRKNSKFLPDVNLPESIVLSSELQEAVNDCDVIVIAVPTLFLRDVLKKLKECSLDGKIIISGTKGIENKSLLTPTQIIKEYLQRVKLAVLSGPSHAEEVAHNIPTCIVITSNDKSIAEKGQSIFMESRFRVYTSDDVLGVELGGALKNIVAIAAGICDGLKFGANTKAALLSRGLQEIIRLGVAMGAKAETFFGLSGMGDLVTTCISPYGRNRAVGERIARGERLGKILKSMEMIAEGVYTTRSAHDLAVRYNIEMPITLEVYRVLYENKDPLQSISDLMLRASKDEIKM